MDFNFQKNDGLSIEQALNLEWLETNGTGGYASSTVLNCATRKYHGLLVSNQISPAKQVLLSQVEDKYIQSNIAHHLSAQKYPGVLQDGSFVNFQSFTNEPSPSFSFQFENTEVNKSLLLLNGEDTLLIKYEVSKSSDQSVIVLRPLFAYRYFHALRKEFQGIESVITECQGGRKFHLDASKPDFFMQANTPFTFVDDPVWYRNYEYPLEKARGYDDHEDLYSPGIFVFPLAKNHEFIVACSVIEQTPKLLASRWKDELKLRKKTLRKLTGTPFQKQLKKVSLSFLQHDPKTEKVSIVAGYPWFASWGRDAMIAAPGLMLFNGLENEFLQVLKTYSQSMKNGLIPNVIGETEEQNAYNSVDASLWFALAVQQYHTLTKETNTVLHHFWQPLTEIFTQYKSGTLFNIKMQENGLLWAGTPETNLTWMDAKANGTPVTPRYGLAVEVNALWINFLTFLHSLAKKFSSPLEEELRELIPVATTAFQSVFWNEEKGYLNDCVTENSRDASLRPNQIFAVSLPCTLLTPEMAESVVKVVQTHLLTPYGLRTLAQNDPRYQGHYSAIQAPGTRDQAYHNGTVWPWLLGAFGEALLKIKPKATVAEILEPAFKALRNHVYEAGVGTVSEIFDGDPPHHPNGCISQAFSVSELLRLSYLVNHFKK